MRPAAVAGVHHAVQHGPMLRREPIAESATVSDIELGIAVLLLGIALLLAAIFVPLIG